MNIERFDELLDGWGQGQYTAQELITHLMKHAQETAATINHHVRLLATMEKRLSEMEEKVKEVQSKGGERR